MSNIEYEDSSGNVFADLGFADADNLAYRAGLVGSIMRCAEERGLTQSALSELINIPQPRVSKLLNGKIEGVTTDKLLTAVGLLGRHVRIVVEEHPKPTVAGRVELEVA